MAKIILTTDVANLGGPGDIVEVKDGYARNYLLPRGYAVTATKGAEKNVQTIRRTQESRRIRDLEHAKEIKASLEELGNVRVEAKAPEGSKRLFGSITPDDVAAAVQSAGGPVLDKRILELDKHIKSVGRYPVRARLHPNVRAEFEIDVTAR